MMKRYLNILLIVLSIIALDQITKYLVSSYLDPSDVIEIFPFLHLVNVKNTGAAFGMFKNLGSSFFIGVSIVAIVFILWLLMRSNYNQFSLSLILGGAIGNLIDRIQFGKVLDFIFINVEVWGHYWPAFNVADSSLTIGITIIFLTSLLKK